MYSLFYLFQVLGFPTQPWHDLWTRIHLFSTELDKGSVTNTWKNKPVLSPWPTKTRLSESVMYHLVSRGSHLFSLQCPSVSGDGKRIVHGTEFNSLFTPQKGPQKRSRIHPCQLPVAGAFLSRDWCQLIPMVVFVSPILQFIINLLSLWF